MVFNEYNMDIFRGFGVEIKFSKKDNFLILKETLTRMGIASHHSNRLFQSCHILHKQGRYVIIHFKELFALDGKPTNISDEDIARRNTIVRLLAEWNLLEVIDKEKVESPILPVSSIKIVPYDEKDDWEFVTKYQVGSRKR